MARAAWICGAVAALIVGVYGAGVAYVHSDGCKQRMQEKLAAQHIQLEGLEVSWLGGVSVKRAVLTSRQAQPLLDFGTVQLSSSLLGTVFASPSDFKPQKVSLIPVMRLSADGSCNVVNVLSELSTLPTIAWPSFEMRLQKSTRGKWQDRIVSCALRVSSTTIELADVKDGTHTICSKLKVVFEQEDSKAKFQYEAADLDIRPYLADWGELPPFWATLAQERLFPCSEKGTLELTGADWKLTDTCKGKGFELLVYGSSSTEITLAFDGSLPEKACQQLFPALRGDHTIAVSLAVDLHKAASSWGVFATIYTPQLREALLTGPLASIALLLEGDRWAFQQTEEGLKVGATLLTAEQTEILARDCKNLLETLLPYFAEKS